METFLPEWLPVVARDIGVVFVILGGIAALWRKVVKKVIDLGKRIEASLRVVEAELKPNGGNSLRDAVDRLEQQHGRLESRIDNIDTKLGAAKIQGF